MGIGIVFLFCRAAWIATNLPLYHEGTFCEPANLAAGTAAPQPDECICGARVSRAGLKIRNPQSEIRNLTPYSASPARSPEPSP